MNYVINLYHILKSVLGYAWAIAGVLLSALIFLGLENWSYMATQLPFMRIHPQYSGGEIVNQFIDKGNEWTIHQPVFDGLFSNRQEGFVQIVCEFKGSTLAEIDQSIDYNQDGISDFNILYIPTQHSAPIVKPHSPEVIKLQRWTPIEEGFLARIEILETNKQS